jgi:hypothetical protein
VVTPRTGTASGGGSENLYGLNLSGSTYHCIETGVFTGGRGNDKHASVIGFNVIVPCKA